MGAFETTVEDGIAAVNADRNHHVHAEQNQFDKAVLVRRLLPTKRYL